MVNQEKTDHEKFEELISELNEIKGKYSFKSDYYTYCFKQVKSAIDEIINTVNR